ncbi:MAG: ATP-binding cassette domain-containing protein [Desulfovibrionaceae bacterium]
MNRDTLSIRIRKRLPMFTLDVDLSCPAGTLTAIVGPSGAGKTTLIRAVAGLERPDQGVIRLGGTVWVDREAGIFVPPQKRGLGLVFQDYTLFPHLTVRKNVAFAATDMRRVDELMEMFGIRHLADARPAHISGGERQRAAFCQALARDPSVLLLDEPFSALDVATRTTLRQELRALKDDLAVPVLHVTHDLGEAQYLGDSVVAVVDGRITPGWLEEQARYAAAEHGELPILPRVCNSLM